METMKRCTEDCLVTPHPLSLSPYEGEREEVLRGANPLSYICSPFLKGQSPDVLTERLRGTTSLFYFYSPFPCQGKGGRGIGYYNNLQVRN